jgi:2-keto-4-pentenoate hydratase/2-oxohepta-3-ene-1,7-dioic acid hydratase in catechol pathway
MRFVTFKTGSGLTWGLVEGAAILDLGAVIGEAIPDVRAALSVSPDILLKAMPSARRYVDSEIELLPVIPNPGKVLCVGHNYETHRKETGREKTAYPSIFVRFPDSQVGHLQPLIRPRVSTMFDYEGELAVIIGKAGRAISESDAMEYVAGYSCYNDASVRDWQWHTNQFTPGKTFPGTGAFGPWLVTREEVNDPATLRVTTRLNGTIVQDQPTADLIFPVPTLISYISTFTPLAAGDVIVTGTPGGVGAKRQPPLWLKPGDIVEVTIEGVGQLSNPVADER